MEIFRHTDNDGDELRVFRRSEDTLEFQALGQVGGSNSAYVSHDAVLNLYAALGEYLYPQHTPEAPNRSLIEQLIEKAVKDQVAAVLPLHLAPVALPDPGQWTEARTAQGDLIGYVTPDNRWGYTDAGARTCSGGYGCDVKAPHVMGGPACGNPVVDPKAPAYCQIDGCTFPSVPGFPSTRGNVHFEHDPEPHDVGHPEPAADATAVWQAELERDEKTAKHRKQYCTCSHSTALHHPANGCRKWINIPGEYCTCRWEGVPR